MKNKKLIETIQDWQKVGQYKIASKRNLSLEDYKKLMRIFQMGNFYYLIFVPPEGKVESISKSMTTILGYKQEEFTTSFFLEIIHPDDVSMFAFFEKKVVEFKMTLYPDEIQKYKSQYSYRIRKADGTYIPILQQSITIHCDDNGAVLRNLVIHTDISSLKPQIGARTLSFISIDDSPSYIDVFCEDVLIKKELILTKREHQILLLLATSMTTKEIANHLFISPETVGTHRKNIHAKTATHSLAELLAVAKEKGWL